MSHRQRRIITTVSVLECDPLDPPRDGSVDDGGAEFEAVATYSCNTGFVPDGPVTSSCTAEGEWSQPPPACNKIRKLGSFVCSNIYTLFFYFISFMHFYHFSDKFVQ